MEESSFSQAEKIIENFLREFEPKEYVYLVAPEKPQKSLDSGLS